MASPHPFVPPTFDVPQALETDAFRLRMLTVNDVVKDFDAVVSSVEAIRRLRPESVWPDGLTLEGNLIDLGWHQREFMNRSSFAFTVVAPDESQVLGCVYLYPTRKQGYDVEVHYWTREPRIGSGLDAQLDKVVKAWLDESWPFERVAYPGRDIDWPTWKSLPEEKR